MDESLRQKIIELLNASPFYRHMDMRVVEAGEGTSKLEMRVKPEVRNVYGILHGGAIAGMLDSACGIALGTLLGEGEVALTVDMRVNFISNTGGGTLTALGRVIHRGSKTGVTQAEIRSEKGALIACGMCTHLLCGIEDIKRA